MDDSRKPIRQAGLVVGPAILVMALTVPVVEFYIFPKLINYQDATSTKENISNHPALFSLAIFIHFTSVVCDVIAGWALYIFLTPVNKSLALLSALMRLMNGAFTIAALSNLPPCATWVCNQTRTIITTLRSSTIKSGLAFRHAVAK